MSAEDPGVTALVKRGAGYALFPTVTKGGLVVGGAHGQGVLYEQGRHTAYCDLTQATVGAQVGGQSFSELLVFESRAALDRFKAGPLAFAAAASAVALQRGVATADVPFVDGVAVVVSPLTGVMVEAAVGGQQFTCQARGAPGSPGWAAGAGGGGQQVRCRAGGAPGSPVCGGVGRGPPRL